jgi:WD40 repeat protein
MLLAGSPPAADKVRVTCPGVEIDEFERPINGPAGRNLGPIELVVLGTAEPPDQKESPDAVYQLKVEKVLYGGAPAETLRLHYWLFPRPTGGRQIFVLVSEAYGGPTEYDLKYSVPINDEQAQRALGAARLDYHALAADAIFVAREIATGGGRQESHLGEVQRLLHGTEPKAGEKVVLEIRDHYAVGNKVVPLRPQPMLYFVRIANDYRHRRVYRVNTRLPMACEADVEAALKRRDVYPIVDTMAQGKTLRGREVIFRGSLDEAITFLGSEKVGPVNLAVRALSRQKDAACEKLARAIERELPRPTESAPGGFRKLRNMIRLLGRLDPGSSRGHLARLLERELDYVGSNPEEPPPAKYPASPWLGPLDDDRVNHALAWLATACDEQVLLKRYAGRLLQLRDRAHGHWKAELQLALDYAHVEDNLELAALAPNTPAGSRRSQPRIYHPDGIDAIAISGDSKYLATGGSAGGIRIWNTTDWTCARRIELEGRISELAFSPDGRFVSAVCSDGRDRTGHRFEWRTGIAGAQLEEPRKEITNRFNRDGTSLLTSDGKYRVTVVEKYAADDEFVQLQVRRTTDASQVVADVRLPQATSGTFLWAMSPDSTQFAIAWDQLRLRIYRLPDLSLIREFHFPQCRRYERESISQLAYSPDGRWLAVSEELRPTPRLFRKETGEELMPYPGHGDYPIDLRFLPDGKTVRSIGADGTICTWDAATLQMLRRISVPTGTLAASVRPSDGRYILCQLTRDPKAPIQVVDAETGNVVCKVSLPLTWFDAGPDENEAATVRRVYWLNDQETLCTDINQHWWRFNYRTGQLLKDGRADIADWTSFVNGDAELTEDGRHLFFVHGAGKGTWGPLRSERIDIAKLTSEWSSEVKIERQPNGHFGLVPGGKFFHLGTHIFDRQTLKLVSARDFPRDELTRIAFSADGRRYAVVIGKADVPDRWPGVDAWSTKHRFLVRVHETLTGKTLAAFSPSVPVWQMAFSGDGQRLATANDDGTIEVREIPAPATR